MYSKAKAWFVEFCHKGTKAYESESRSVGEKMVSL